MNGQGQILKIIMMNIYLLPLLLRELDAYRTVNHTQFNSTRSGKWFNRGQLEQKCFQSQVTSEDRCSENGLDRLMPEQSWNLDYAGLVEQIGCALEKLTCVATDGPASFQMHDIPCQSTCLTILQVCHNAQMTDHILIPGCPMQLQSHGPDALGWNGATYNSWSSQRYPPTLGGSTPFSDPIYPQNQYSPTLLPRDLSQNRYPPYQQNYPSTQHRYNLNTIRWASPYHTQRKKRQAFVDSRSQTPQFSIRNNPEIYRATSTIKTAQSGIQLMKSDCYQLPVGGCHQLVDGKLNSRSENLKINPGCPDDLADMCSQMFPKDLTKQEWINGQFTVAAVIRISQTLWWFGENDRHQPLFRFHVTKTLISDIHPYDDKMIHTYAWPSRCVCPEEIIVGKKYLMLTHSFKTRQTLNITPNTKFMSRVKRYIRKLSCWKGNCPRKLKRNRRRRYPNHSWNGWNN